MQAIVETASDIVLGAGDSFHLVPRALGLLTTGLENWTCAYVWTVAIGYMAMRKERLKWTAD